MGDGATNEGAFHEGLNMAAIWDLPALFVVENNLYAASTPVGVTFKIENIADRAGSLWHGERHLRRHGRVGSLRGRGPRHRPGAAGGGPTLLECKTYRLCGHSRSDPRTYRSKDEEAEWATRDPITRLAAQMKEAGLATDESLAQIEAEVVAAIDDAVAFAESSPSPAPEEALEDVFWGEGPVPFAAAGEGGVR